MSKRTELTTWNVDKTCRCLWKNALWQNRKENGFFFGSFLMPYINCRKFYRPWSSSAMDFRLFIHRTQMYKVKRASQYFSLRHIYSKFRRIDPELFERWHFHRCWVFQNSRFGDKHRIDFYIHEECTLSINWRKTRNMNYNLKKM